MSDKTIYFTRHAQAEHNVAEDYTIPDAPLTKLGREQSANLRKETENDNIQQKGELLVTSPLKRPMQTLIIGYAPLRECLEKEGKPVIVMPELQEVNNLPCDTGSPLPTLSSHPEFAGLDFSPVTASEEKWGVGWTSKQGIFDPERVVERAKWVRSWLRDRPEKRIVVVAHGDILRCITDGYRSATPWNNAEVRAYTFKSATDDDAAVVPVAEIAKEGEAEPTSGEIKEGRR
ncbi:hypothetical protein JCM6882_007400 [Rhodosporidiobolus microsporus]